MFVLGLRELSLFVLAAQMLVLSARANQGGSADATAASKVAPLLLERVGYGAVFESQEPTQDEVAVYVRSVAARAELRRDRCRDAGRPDPSDAPYGLWATCNLHLMPLSLDPLPPQQPL